MGSFRSLKNLPLFFSLVTLLLISIVLYLYAKNSQQRQSKSLASFSEAKLLYVKNNLEQESARLSTAGHLLRAVITRALLQTRPVESPAKRLYQILNQVSSSTQGQYHFTLFNQSGDPLAASGQKDLLSLYNKSPIVGTTFADLTHNGLRLHFFYNTTPHIELTTGVASVLITRVIVEDELLPTSSRLTQSIDRDISLILADNKQAFIVEQRGMFKTRDNVYENKVSSATLDIPSLDLELSTLINKSQTTLPLSDMTILMLLLLLLTCLSFAALLYVTLTKPIIGLNNILTEHSRLIHEHTLAKSPWYELLAISNSLNKMVRQFHKEKLDFKKQLLEKKAELHSNIVTLREQSWRDPLTDLYNRRAFLDRAEELLSLELRTRSECAIVMIDIDHFKGINDKRGHVSGDKILKHVAKLIKGGLRKSDIIARVGGEEFCLLLPESNPEIAKAIMNKLRQKIQDTHFLSDEQGGLTVTCSFGIAQLDHDANAIEGLQEKADMALYYAKRTGRNRVVHYAEMPTEEQKFG